jgi:hypothetical protein
MRHRLSIDRRFRGPPESGNGGWTCGALAELVGGRVEVTLRSPPPLDTELEVEVAGDRVRLHHGHLLVAEAEPASGELRWPPFVGPSDAVAASARFAGHLHHAFPSCFTCGTARAEGDGLRIFAGPVEDRPELVAATWTPSPSVADERGLVGEPVIWAALDCPSVWPYLGDGTVALLGRMTAVVSRRPVAGETYVVVGAGTGSDGRKRFASAALFTGAGERVAVSRTTWITVDP